MTDRNREWALITPIGTSFIEVIVPHLMAEAFTAYKKRDFTKMCFKVNSWENSHSAAAIVLIATVIEAHRNRIYCLEKEKISRNVPQDIQKIFAKKLPAFPGKDGKDFESIVKEVFVLRDVVTHGHIWELSRTFSRENRGIVTETAQKSDEYGDKKFKELVNAKTEKTERIGFNIQPLKIGFEDLFKTLLVLDLFAGIAEKALGQAASGQDYVSFALLPKCDNHGTEKLSQLLTCYYDRVPNQEFVKALESLSEKLRRNFASFLPSGGDCFITNACPGCRALGFHCM
jgi:uncharacterized protein (DUF2267 family)